MSKESVIRALKCLRFAMAPKTEDFVFGRSGILSKKTGYGETLTEKQYNALLDVAKRLLQQVREAAEGDVVWKSEDNSVTVRVSKEDSITNPKTYAYVSVCLVDTPLWVQTVFREDYLKFAIRAAIRVGDAVCKAACGEVPDFDVMAMELEGNKEQEDNEDDDIPF